MITSLLVRCSYVWLFGWLAVSTVSIPFLYVQKGIPGAASGLTYVVITATLAGCFSVLPRIVSRMCIERKTLWAETWRAISQERLLLLGPFSRLADFLLAAVVVTLTAVPLYGLFWTAGQHLAFLACSLGNYETGERISKTVRISTAWNEETLVGLFDRARAVEQLGPGLYESDKTRAINDAIASVYGYESRQMARRFKQLGDNSLTLMRRSPAGSPEAAEAVCYAESRYLNALDIYRGFPVSGGLVDTLAQLSFCKHVMGDRSASFLYCSEALSAVARIDMADYESVHSLRNVLRLHKSRYYAIGGPNYRPENLFWAMGLLSLPGIVFLRLLMPVILMSDYARRLYRRIPDQTSVRVALQDLDKLAVTQLCLDQLDAADEATKVMLKLAETEDVTVVRTIVQTPMRHCSMA